MTELSLVSINIEREKHLDLVIPYLSEQHADVVCIQELLERDIATIERALSVECFYAPSTLYPTEEGLEPEGVAIFTRLPISEKKIGHYAGRKGDIMPFGEGGSPEEKAASQGYALVSALIEKDGSSFRIATTHFPWTPNGEADDIQREAVKKMLIETKELGELVLCGDFNAPRGKEIFTQIVAELKDNIPETYETSLDINLHRAGKTQGERLSKLMVDGLFTTPEYAASDVSLVPGISDHCAIRATITRA